MEKLTQRRKIMKMNQVTVEKQKLLDIIEENKEQHIEDYTEAMKGYRVGVVAGLEQLDKDVKKFAKKVKVALEEARNGGKLKTDFSLDSYSQFNKLVKPESHEKEYTLAFDMIKLDTDDEVELTRGEFKQFVNDEWDWTENFTHQITGSLANYTEFSGSAATIKNYGE
jgi:hypothetical protein